ncbi:MAG: hypothetical protein RL550_1246 [Actinomycetota bacterium]
MHGLLSRTALAIDGGARNVLGQPSCQPAGAGDAARLRTHRVDVAEDHVVDGGRVDSRAVDERLDGVGTEVGRMH